MNQDIPVIIVILQISSEVRVSCYLQYFDVIYINSVFYLHIIFNTF